MTIPQLEAILSQRPQSPLFARLASCYLAGGRVEQAKELCRTGLEQFPTYASAYVILAKCHATSGDYAQAVEELQRATILFPNSPLVTSLIEQWSQPIAKETGIETNTAAPSEEPSAMEEVELAEPSTGSSEKSDPPAAYHILSATPPVSGESASGEIGTSLTAPATPSTGSLDHQGRIVSRTLAEIYATQGAYEEAIMTYTLLKQREPDKSSEIDERVRELEAQRQARSS